MFYGGDMTRGFVLRQAVGAALAANALRPLPGAPTSVVAFFSGWLTTELAPHLLAVTAADQHAARHGTRTRSDRVGLALAAASAAGLAAVIATGRGAGAEAESALV